MNVNSKSNKQGKQTVSRRSRYNEACRRSALAFTWLFGKLDADACFSHLTDELNEFIIYIEEGSSLPCVFTDEFSHAFVSGQIYGAACESLFGLSPSHWNQSGFQGLCRFLINRGVSLQANFNVQSLTHVPLDQTSHCVLIESLMGLDIRISLTCEKISASRFQVLSNCHLLLPWQQVDFTILHWLNESATGVNEYLEKHWSEFDELDELTTGDEGAGRGGVALIDDVVHGISDGQSLLAVICFYFPNVVPLSAGRFCDLMSFSDCVHNLSLVCDFISSPLYTENYSNVQPWLLTVEDLVYPNLSLRVHVVNALVQLYLAVKGTPPNETLSGSQYLSQTSLKSSPENEPWEEKKAEENSDFVNGFNANLRSKSMNSFAAVRNAASTDPAGDALLELESRWKQNNPSRSNTVSPSLPSPPSEVNLRSHKISPQSRRVENARSPRNPRVPSEDSAFGTMSSNSQTSSRSNLSTILQLRGPKTEDSSKTRKLEESSSQIESGGKTYSKRNTRPSNPRTSVHELTEMYERDAKPLSAMKNEQHSGTTTEIIPKNMQRSRALSGNNANAGNVTSFGNQSKLRSNNMSSNKGDGGVRVTRPKSALDERMFTAIRGGHGDDSDDVNSEPEVSMMTSSVRSQANEYGVSSSAKMSAIKLKMEERRRCIQKERAKLEAARSKHRQEIGKTAFMRVIKANDNRSGSGDKRDQNVNESEEDEEEDKSGSPMEESDGSLVDCRRAGTTEGGYESYGSEVVRRQRTPNERQNFANRRQRARSTNLDNSDFQYTNQDPPLTRKISAEVQTSIDLQTHNQNHNSYYDSSPISQFSTRNLNSRSNGNRPMSYYMERDELDSLSSGIGSNQSTLRRTKALSRPSTARGEHMFVENQMQGYHNNQMEDGEIRGARRGDEKRGGAGSSVDLTSSLERDMLIEQNQILARELQTLKHKFITEMETRKLHSEREMQMELQRQQYGQSISRNSSREQLNSFGNPNTFQPHQMNLWHNNSSHPDLINSNTNRLPQVINHNQIGQQPNASLINRHQPFSHIQQYPVHQNQQQQGVFNPYGSSIPMGQSVQLNNLHHQGQMSNNIPNQGQMRSFQGQALQPPYAVHEQELYHNYETTHKQEYHYETLHGSHHNYYQQSLPYNQNQNLPTSSSDNQSHQNLQMVDSQSNIPSSERKFSVHSQTSKGNNLNPDESLRPIVVSPKPTIKNENLNCSNDNFIQSSPRSEGRKVSSSSNPPKRPQTLSMESQNEKDSKTEETSKMRTRGKNVEKKDTFESSCAISPLDPEVQISSSVEVTPENSPVHVKSKRSNKNDVMTSDEVDSKRDAIDKSGATSPSQQKSGKDPPLIDTSNFPKKAEAFSVNFFASANTNSKEFAPPKPRLTTNKRTPTSSSSTPNTRNNGGVKLSAAKSSEPMSSNSRKVKSVASNPNIESSSSSANSSTTVDEALKIVQECDYHSPISKKRMGGVALVIDVDKIDSPSADVMGDNQRQSKQISQSEDEEERKRREKAEEFLRRQREKQQRDLEKRRKATEDANAESVRRQTMEAQAQEQKKLEAQARRERIMAQYLQKKAEKELEESGRAPPKTPQARGLVGGGGGATGRAQQQAKSGPASKPRSKSTTAKPTNKSQQQQQQQLPRSRRGSTSSRNGDSGFKLTRSRKNSVENLLSDGGESLVSSAMDTWEVRSEFSEYNGPKLFVKPTSKSNKLKIQNAITQSVFPGAVNSDMKNKILQQIDSCTSISSGDPNIVVDASGGKHFLILFRDHALKFRAIYLCEGDCEEGVITKVTGMGPQNVKLHMIQDLYKYDSGGKRFLQIPSKTMSVSVDAFTIQNQLWKKK